MLSRELIRTRPEEVRRAVELRCDTAPLDEIVEIDAAQRRLKTESDDLKAERNRISKSFGKGMGDEEKERLRARATELRDLIAGLNERIDEYERRLSELELWVPNIPEADVPVGTTEEDNVVRWTWGDVPQFPFPPISHADLGEELGIFVTEEPVRMSGTRFYSLRGPAAEMERALAALMLDIHVREHGFRECWVPYLVKREAMVVSAQLPKFAEDAYYLPDEDMYLIPTAEVPLVNMEVDKILDADRLPILYTAYTPSFRLEAGAAGRETRGMLRVHQFDKVEMVVLCAPEDSGQWLTRLVQFAEEVLQRLKLPYHVLEMNTSDLGFGQTKKYDLEVWMPSLERYVEISSCSNMGDFQARRGKMRYRPEPGSSPRLLHTLNGSGVAIGRCMAAIWENYQRADGTIEVPEALRPYMHGCSEIVGCS
ncbi:MAG TPA: serine--tRNA ligase [Chloroflexota bacterium]